MQKTKQEIDKLMDKLTIEIKNDSFIADTKRGIKETFESSFPNDIDEIVQLFEEDWEQTPHWELNYENKIRRALRKKYPDENSCGIYDKLFDYKEELWEAYHSEYNTYQVAQDFVDGVERW